MLHFPGILVYLLYFLSCLKVEDYGIAISSVAGGGGRHGAQLGYDMIVLKE